MTITLYSGSLNIFILHRSSVVSLNQHLPHFLALAITFVLSIPIYLVFLGSTYKWYHAFFFFLSVSGLFYLARWGPDLFMLLPMARSLFQAKNHTHTLHIHTTHTHPWKLKKQNKTATNHLKVPSSFTAVSYLSYLIISFQSLSSLSSNELVVNSKKQRLMFPG